MFGISFPELLLVMVIILLVFGPERLPDAARTFGKFMAQFKRSSDSVRREFYNAIYKPADDFGNEIQRGTRNLISFGYNEPNEHPNCETIKNQEASQEQQSEADKKDGEQGQAS